MHRYDAGVRMSGDDGEATVLLDGGEQERAGAGEAEAVLAADGPAGPLARDLLGIAGLVEGAHRDEAAALCYGLGPHAEAAATELLECGLDAGVEDGVGLAVEREAPLERGHPEAARAVRHEERDLRAGARVSEGVGRLYVADGMTPRAARAKHGPRLLHRERAEPHAHVRASSLLAAIIPGDAPL